MWEVGELDMGISDVQVEKKHYDFENYVNKQRWMSYWYQIKEALTSGCKSFLYIGKGDGIVVAILKELIKEDGIVETFDFDERLSPTWGGYTYFIYNSR